MYSAANNAICEVSLSSHQLTQLIGPANLLQFDIVKDKIEEKKIEIQKKNSRISYLNSKLKRNTLEKGEIIANLTKSHEVCERLEEENFILRAADKTSSSQVNILTIEKEKLAGALSRCESQIKEILLEKNKLQSASLAQKSYVKFISAQNSKLTSEKEKLTESLAQSSKLCEELKEGNRKLTTQVEDCQEDNLYLQSENRELSRSPSTVCDLCLSVDIKENHL
jgi:chromosome segregation ATPase